MQGNIVKHADQLGWKVRVTWYDVCLLLHRCCNLKVIVVRKYTLSKTKTKKYYSIGNILVHYVLEESKQQGFQQAV